MSGSLEPGSPPRPSSSAHKIKRGKRKEGESPEDLDHVLDMDDVFWTWFSISGRCRPRTTTTNTMTQQYFEMMSVPTIDLLTRLPETVLR